MNYTQVILVVMVVSRIKILYRLGDYLPIISEDGLEPNNEVSLTTLKGL
ncbi:hypothetical protein N7X28_22745 [Bacillus sp. SM-B1]|nr:hypothetical protein [Bacillus sp. SM-B1]